MILGNGWDHSLTCGNMAGKDFFELLETAKEKEVRTHRVSLKWHW